MIIVIKLLAAAALTLAILSPGGGPLRVDECQCKADTAAQKFVPRADDCECKAKAD